ncbi:MAG: hypothetical protein M1309_00575 [Actinobacteria bacterium]|nr:hypothetical protein [Actinomycetota bacterium]
MYPSSFISRLFRAKTRLAAPLLKLTNRRYFAILPAGALAALVMAASVYLGVYAGRSLLPRPLPEAALPAPFAASLPVMPLVPAPAVNPVPSAPAAPSAIAASPVAAPPPSARPDVSAPANHIDAALAPADQAPNPAGRLEAYNGGGTISADEDGAAQVEPGGHGRSAENRHHQEKAGNQGGQREPAKSAWASCGRCRSGSDR